MQTFQYLIDLRAHKPADDTDKYAFFEQKKQLFVWAGGEWVERKYFDVRNIAHITGYSLYSIRQLLKDFPQQFERKKKKGHIRLTYGQVLKIKYMLDARIKGTLPDLLAAGTIENLYANSRDHHAINSI